VWGEVFKMDENQTTPANAPGGDGLTRIDSLDLSDRKDCALLNKAARRWKLTPRFMQRVPAALEAALDMAEAEGDYKSIAVIASTAATLEGQNQKDEHAAKGLSPSGNVNNGPTQINYYLAQPPATGDIEGRSNA